MSEIALGIQLAFVTFFGPPLSWMMAFAVVGTIAEVFIGMFRDDVQRVKIVGRDDE
jgi:hypothetical protein